MVSVNNGKGAEILFSFQANRRFLHQKQRGFYTQQNGYHELQVCAGSPHFPRSHGNDSDGSQWM